jgi:hypothetical protein
LACRPFQRKGHQALGGIDTVTFGFRLVDATVSYLGNTVVIDGPGEGRSPFADGMWG